MSCLVYHQQKTKFIIIRVYLHNYHLHTSYLHIPITGFLKPSSEHFTQSCIFLRFSQKIKPWQFIWHKICYIVSTLKLHVITVCYIVDKTFIFYFFYTLKNRNNRIWLKQKKIKVWLLQYYLFKQSSVWLRTRSEPNLEGLERTLGRPGPDQDQDWTQWFGTRIRPWDFRL